MIFTQFLHDTFGLPGGGLWPNLVASGLLGLGGFLYGRAFEKRSIERHEAMKAHINMHMLTLHDKLDRRAPLAVGKEHRDVI